MYIQEITVNLHLDNFYSSDSVSLWLGIKSYDVY